MSSDDLSDPVAKDIALRFEDMLTGAHPEDIQWVWISEFPAWLVLYERDWNSFLDEQEAQHGSNWLDSLVKATLSGSLSDEPLVMAAVPFDEPPVDREEGLRSWINIWDGNHRLAVLLGHYGAANTRDATVQVAFGWPLGMRLDELPLKVRALPEIQRARLTENQMMARKLLDVGERYLGERLQVSLTKAVLIQAVSTTLEGLGVGHRTVQACRAVSDPDGRSVGATRFMEAIEVDGLYLNGRATGGLEDLFFDPDSPMYLSSVKPRFSEVEEVPDVHTMAQYGQLSQVLEVMEAAATSWKMEEQMPAASPSVPRIRV